MAPRSLCAKVQFVEQVDGLSRTWRDIRLGNGGRHQHWYSPCSNLVQTFFLNRQEIEAVGPAGHYLIDDRYCEPFASPPTDGGHHSPGQNPNRRSAQALS